MQGPRKMLGVILLKEWVLLDGKEKVQRMWMEHLREVVYADYIYSVQPTDLDNRKQEKTRCLQ